MNCFLAQMLIIHLMGSVYKFSLINVCVCNRVDLNRELLAEKQAGGNTEGLNCRCFKRDLLNVTGIEIDVLAGTVYEAPEV